MTTAQAPSSETATLWERAQRVTPGGVNSPVRAMRSVGRSLPVMIQSASGSLLTDVDGNTYTDWIQSWGALPLGHAHPRVVDAARSALEKGSTYGAPTPGEVDLAELICSLVPSVEQVRFTSSGTEATMSALRVARAATGHDAVITFSGCYHGHSDPFLATGGSGLATLGIPSSPGVPAATAALTRIARYGDLASVQAIVDELDGKVAAIFIEPVAANMGVVVPPAPFLQGLRDICDRTGAILVFDEVISGFRLGPDGAQGLFGITADLTTFGKIIGGGMPCGAFAGKRELMQLVAPVGKVYQAGTLSGNPVAMAAGKATLEELIDNDGWAELNARGESLTQKLAAATSSNDRVAVSGCGSLVTLFHLGDGLDHAPANFDDAGMLDTTRFGETHAAALAAGHMLPPSQFEAMFCSLAHDDSDIVELVEVLSEACAK